jgi:hypothetical protein
MCDNSLLAEQFRQRIDQATAGVDEALESVRAIKAAMMNQIAQDSADQRDKEVTPDELVQAIETIRRHNADVDRDIYLDQADYLRLMVRSGKTVRLEQLHREMKSSLGLVCGECRDEYGNLVSWPCNSARILA